MPEYTTMSCSCKTFQNVRLQCKSVLSAEPTGKQKPRNSLTFYITCLLWMLE